MSKLEISRDASELGNSGGILTIWHKRLQDMMPKNSCPDFFYNRAETNGNESLKTIVSQYGEGSALKLLDMVNGFNLETQARLLSLGRVDAPILIKAVRAYPKRWTPKELMLKLIPLKPDKLSFQGGVYRKVVRKVLAEKFPGQDASGLIKNYPSTSDWYDRFCGTAELALQKGPDFLLEAFNFIPPEEIMPDCFDERLEFEKRARGEGKMPVTRIYKFTGRVQGVGFRDFCGKRAVGLWGRCIAGNMTDGSVKVILQGSPETLDGYMATFCQDAMKELGIPLPTVTLEKEAPRVRLTKRMLDNLFGA